MYAVKELWLRASDKLCLTKVWNIATRTYGSDGIISNKDNMGQRLLRLLKNPKSLDKIFMPRGPTRKSFKRPSPPV